MPESRRIWKQLRSSDSKIKTFQRKFALPFLLSECKAHNPTEAQLRAVAAIRDGDSSTWLLRASSIGVRLHPECSLQVLCMAAGISQTPLPSLLIHLLSEHCPLSTISFWSFLTA